MANLATSQGYTFSTDLNLGSPPAPVSIPELNQDRDPNWISIQTLYHPSGFRRAQSYLKFYVPYNLHEPSIRDHWVTPSDAGTMFTNETIAFVADISLPILDNFYPNLATGGQAASVALGIQQKRDREAGIKHTPDASSGSYKAPAVVTSLATTIEIKKRLPPGGTKWLFMRSRARQIKDGRMSQDVVILDEMMELVALSTQLYQLIDFSRVTKERL